uniref:Family with sequence similarity 120C n=1 Tax=Monodelphis domestica TaxID=13616 RepID=A0A5F8H7I1_MONDO
MGVQSFQEFLEKRCPGAVVSVDLLKLARTMSRQRQQQQQQQQRRRRREDDDDEEDEKERRREDEDEEVRWWRRRRRRRRRRQWVDDDEDEEAGLPGRRRRRRQRRHRRRRPEYPRAETPAGQPSSRESGFATWRRLRPELEPEEEEERGEEEEAAAVEAERGRGPRRGQGQTWHLPRRVRLSQPPRGLGFGTGAGARRRRPARAPRGARVLVDAASALPRLYGGYHLDWVCGGQWSSMLRYLAALCQACSAPSGGPLELVVMFPGGLGKERLPEWTRRCQTERQLAQLIVGHVGKRGTPPPRAWFLPPACLSHCVRLALLRFRVQVRTPVLAWDSPFPGPEVPPPPSLPTNRAQSGDSSPSRPCAVGGDQAAALPARSLDVAACGGQGLALALCMLGRLSLPVLFVLPIPDCLSLSLSQKGKGWANGVK